VKFLVITEIQKGKQSLVEVYVDNKFYAFIDIKTAENFGIHKGMPVTEEWLAALQKQSEESRARVKAVQLLAKRDYTAFELCRKLSAEVSQVTAEAVVQEMETAGYVNDERYAERYAEELYTGKGYAGERIRLELHRKGIDAAIAEHQATVYGTREYPEEILARIRQIINSRYSREVTTEKGRRKVVAALRRMGYNWNDIQQELNCGEDYFE